MLQLILGRAGSGKTEYVFSNIKKLVDAGEKNILLITPEQYSFISERRLLTELGESRVNCVENGSFSRLSNEISKKYGGNSLPTLSKGAKAVMFKKACESVKEELKLFGKNVNNVAFINSAIKIYDEMKSCRVSPEDILEAANNTKRETLSQKLVDISTIMSAYDNMIDGKFFDGASELTRLYERLVNLDYFVGKTVFIDGFNGFVAQEYKILEVIIKQAKMVYVTFCTDSVDNSDKYDLFSYVNSNIVYLKEATENAGSKMLDPIPLNNSYRFNNEELEAVEKFAFSNDITQLEKDISSVHIYGSKSIQDECDYVSSNISKLLRKGVRASNIAVICRDLEKYQKELQFSFSKYNVPFYNDERQNISNQPLIMFVNFLMRSVMYSFRSDDIFSLIKTGLTALDNQSINELENYAFLWNINGSKWKNDFKDSTKGFVEKITDNDQKAIDSINESRKYIIDKLVHFSNACKNKTTSDICKAIYYTLLDFSVDKGINALAKALDENGKSVLAIEQGRVWDLLMEILDKLATIDNNEEITIKEFYKYFNLMISNEDLGAIPAGLDNVQLGSADRIRCDNPYAVFVVGANEGEFPQSVSSAGLLSESDRIELIENKFKLYSYGEILNAQERYFAYMAISSATDELYVTYRNTSKESTASSIVSNIKDVLPKLEEVSFSSDCNMESLETDANAFEVLTSNYDKNTEFISTLKEYFSNNDEYKGRLDSFERLVNNDDVQIEDKNLAKELFKNDMYISASKVEDYFNCAFRYFCKFGLSAKPRSKAEMDPMQTGTVIHYVLECIIKEVGSKGLADLGDFDIYALVNKHLENFMHTKMGDSSEFTPRFKYQFMRLSNMLSYVVIRLRDEFQNSDFEAKAFELKIGNGDENEPVKSQVINLPDGGSIQIKGSIDRVDTFTKDGEQYVRVVDYKSGNKEFQLSDIMYGLNLQMFIYLFNLCKSDNELSGTEAGVLYMHSARNVYNLDRNFEAKDYAKEDDSSFLMKGIVLNDDTHDIAYHMDYELQQKYIPVKYAKEKLTGNIVSLADLGRMSKKIDSLLTEMGVNLHNGIINQNPVSGSKHDKTCEYCDYADVCLNRKEVTPREIEQIKFDDVLNMLKEDVENA